MHPAAIAEHQPFHPSGEPIGRLGHDHVATVGACTEACRDVERRAAEAPVFERDRLARVDADPDAERKIVVERRLLVEPRLERHGAPDRLASGGEDRESLVTADLDDLAAVRLHLLGEELDELRGQPGGRLRAELLRVARVAADVGDQERLNARLAGHGLPV